MPVLQPERLTRELAAGERGGVFFLFGEEDYLKDRALAELVDAHLDDATRDFNLDQVRGGEVPPEQLASLIQTPPMMGAWRVVVVRDAHELAAHPTMRGVIEATLDAPPPGLALILVASIPAGSRAKFYATLKKAARAVEYAPLADADVPGWLLARARQDGLELEPGAAQAMAAAIGPVLGPLESEMRKLREYVGARTRITREDVAAVVGEIPRQNRWAWFDAVAEQRFAEARAALPVLLEAGESGVGLVIGLGNQFLRVALALGGGQRRLESELPPRQRWLAARIAGQARRWDAASVDAALDDLLRADRLLKSAPLPDRQIMEELLLRLEHRARERRAA